MPGSHPVKVTATESEWSGLPAWLRPAGSFRAVDFKAFDTELLYHPLCSLPQAVEVKHVRPLALDVEIIEQ